MTSSQPIEPETPLGNDLEFGSYTALRLVCVTVQDGSRYLELALTEKFRNMPQLNTYI